MAAKPVINAYELVRDIKAGLNDAELMQKYRLSHKGLQSVFRKLADAKLMSPGQLYGRSSEYEDTADLGDYRLTDRAYLEVSLPIYDLGSPDNIGAVRDLTERGISVRGLQAAPNESKTLVIRADELFSIPHIVFQAVCRWAKRDSGNDQWTAGFQITEISPEDLEHLQAVVRLLSFSD
ncbi:MAG: PilZ domain-containing protein [Deltaproteobacteria bacterium]|nr:PilZ domain-containing protein [Deltaproteobacteria bacterium]